MEASFFDVCAHGILPFVAAATWKHSRTVSVALAAAFVLATFYVFVPIDELRWFCAGLTGSLGLVELGRRAWLRMRAWKWNERWSGTFGFTTHFPATPDVLAALLVGSSVADYVSLHREAAGHPWGSLSIWQLAVGALMIAISYFGKRTLQEEADRQAASKIIAHIRAVLQFGRAQN